MGTGEDITVNLTPMEFTESRARLMSGPSPGRFSNGLSRETLLSVWTESFPTISNRECGQQPCFSDVPSGPLACSVLIPFVPVQFGPRDFQSKSGIAFRALENCIVTSVDTIPVSFHDPASFGMDVLQPSEFGLQALARSTIHAKILRQMAPCQLSGEVRFIPVRSWTACQ
jgi:hypothetical protein